MAPLVAASGIRLSDFRLIDRAPVAWPTGKAAYLHVEYQAAAAGKSVKCQSLALVCMSPLPDGSWFFYVSSVTALAESFARSLPVLLDVYKSWKVEDHVFQERLQGALRSMRETSRIINEGYASRQRVLSRAMDDWAEYMRGTSVVRDHRFGEHHELASTYVDRLNQREGYPRYEIIPLKELNNPWRVRGEV